MFFNGNTYTDFHELNLDYWIKLIKQIQTELEEIDISGMKEDIAANTASITTLQNDVSTLQSEMSNLSDSFDDLSDAVQDFFTDVDTALTAMDLALKAYSDAGDVAVKLWCLTQLQSYSEALQAQIDTLYEYVKDLPDSFYVYDEYTGELEPLSETLRIQARATNSIHGLTCAQYEALGITVQEYDDKMLNNLEYLVKGAILLPNDNPLKWMFNPITGQKETIYQTLAFIFQWFSSGFTVGDYDALSISVSDYDSLGLTIEDYYFSGVTP